MGCDLQPYGIVTTSPTYPLRQNVAMQLHKCVFFEACAIGLPLHIVGRSCHGGGATQGSHQNISQQLLRPRQKIYPSSGPRGG